MPRANPVPLSEVLQASLDLIRERKRQLARTERTDLDEWLDAAPVPPKRLKRKKMTSEAISVVEKKPLARVTDDQGVSVDVVVARVEKVREVQRRIMKLDTHYGKVPGTQKDCLLKPGAEILGLTFQLDPEFANVERWEGEHLESVVTCTLFHAPTGTRLGSGIGSCSTREKKYAWRNGGAKCPSCGKEGSLLKSKDKPEWFCWRKKDGCGATFPAKDERITGQKTGRVPNPDLADNYNTVRKMACKRAHVAAILFVTCASEIFTQDVEDSDERDQGYSPHVQPGEDPDATGDADLFRDLCGRFSKLEADLEQCDSWDKCNALRAILGTRAQQSELTRTMQQKAESGDISPSQRAELGKTWMRANRKLEGLEKKLAPTVEATFERQPGDDDPNE